MRTRSQTQKMKRKPAVTAFPTVLLRFAATATSLQGNPAVFSKSATTSRIIASAEPPANQAREHPVQPKKLQRQY